VTDKRIAQQELNSTNIGSLSGAGKQKATSTTAQSGCSVFMILVPDTKLQTYLLTFCEGYIQPLCSNALQEAVMPVSHNYYYYYYKRILL